MECGKLTEILNKITLFKDLKEQELQSIVHMPKAYKTFAPGEVIVKEGDRESCFYILLTGSATVSLKDQELAYIVPPQFVGEVGFIFKEARIATVIASKQTLAMQLDADMFSRLPITVRETVKDKIIAGLVLRLARLNESIVHIKKGVASNLTLNEVYSETA